MKTYNDDSETRPSLLEPLRSGDREGWDAIVAKYSPRIREWAVRRGLRGPDAEDVVQNVLTSLVSISGRFRYDPQKSFRAYLKTVTARAVADYITKRREMPRGGSGFLELLQGLEVTDDLAMQFDEQFLHDLVRSIEETVRWRFEERTWRAYDLLKQDLSGRDVADTLGLSVDQVYNAKHRILEAIRGEVERIRSKSR